MAGLCLIAVFAIAAVATTSASALPEWGKCEAKVGGKYEDSNCTKKAKGKAGIKAYEWKKGATLKNIPFTGHSVGSGGVLAAHLIECVKGTYQFYTVPSKQCEEGGGKLESALGTVLIECEKEDNTGEATGKSGLTNITVKFKGCLLYGAVPCTTPGEAEGTVRVEKLKGFLGYISKPGKEVGVVLEPVLKHGRFAEFVCSEILKNDVGQGNKKEGAWNAPESQGGYDQIISPITPVNTMTSKYTQVYTVNPTTHQNIPNKLEKKHLSVLEDKTRWIGAELGEGATLWSAAGEEITNENTTAEEGEIKA